MPTENKADKFSVFRVPFTQVANNVLNDKNLSLRAKGLFAYLYSKPENWDFNYVRIAKDHKESKNTVLKTLQELENAGYLERKKLNSGRTEYLLTYEPKTKDWSEPKTKNCRDQKLQRPKIGHISNIDIINNTEIINNKDHAQSKIALEIRETKQENEIIPDLIKDKNKHIQIIGLWARARRVVFETRKQQEAYIRRNVRAAAGLTAYPFDRIIATMKYLSDQKRFIPTLETVGKFIDEKTETLYIANNKQMFTSI